MLKKLRFKFVIVIMMIVTVLFSAVFGCVMYFTKKNIERESIQMMGALAFAHNTPMSVSPPENVPDNIRFPFFRIIIDNDGNMDVFGGDYYDFSDEDFLNKIFSVVSSKTEKAGIIPEYNLRYLKSYKNNTECIVFADISSEKAMLSGLIRNSVVIGLIGYIIFFVISLMLARWVTKPVEKAWNEQKQFIADASHELKTPLTVIMTNAEMLEDDSYTETDKNSFTKNILSMSKRMRGLVESLLELARMDNGTSSKENQLFDYSKLVSDCILPFEPLFFEKNMELSVDIDNHIQVEGDQNKLRQVIDILLDNALKYSDTKYPVQLKLKQQGLHGILSVSSRGTPLSKFDCKNIFKRFYRVDKARNDGQSYGLGLSIADSIMKEHKGKIWAESENGYNSFYVSVIMK